MKHLKPNDQDAVIEAFQRYTRAFQTLDPSAVVSHETGETLARSFLQLDEIHRDTPVN